MHTPAYHTQLIIAASERLGRYLQALPRDAWDHLSACQGWTVRDVVGHLVWGAELYATTVTRGLHGASDPFDGLPPAGSVTGDSAAPLFDQLSLARGASLGEQLLPTFLSSSAHLSAVFAGVGPQGWNAVCYHPGGLAPAWAFVDFRLTELVMHGWDIRSRFEPTMSLPPESVPVFLSVLAAGIGWIFRPGPPPSAPVRYRFAMTDPVPSSLDIVVSGTQAQVEHDSMAQADVTLQCSAETWVFLMYGRLRLQEALAQGRITADGPTDLVTAFAQWFRGV